MLSAKLVSDFEEAKRTLRTLILGDVPGRAIEAT